MLIPEHEFLAQTIASIVLTSSSRETAKKAADMLVKLLEMDSPPGSQAWRSKAESLWYEVGEEACIVALHMMDVYNSLKARLAASA
jgi:hypothetical protein